MILDTSALLAVLQDEPERRAFNRAIEAADARALSVASWVEASLVIESRYGAAGLHDLDAFVERADIEIVPVDLEQGRLARRAFGRYGKGRHPASLNYGDCFTYALASQREEPLLFKGDDFGQTDLLLVDLTHRRSAGS
jgi:ribonuclease VapC